MIIHKCSIHISLHLTNLLFSHIIKIRFNLDCEINHERYGDNFAGQRLRMNVGGKRQTGEKALAELISLFDE